MFCFRVRKRINGFTGIALLFDYCGSKRGLDIEGVKPKKGYLKIAETA